MSRSPELHSYDDRLPKPGWMLRRKKFLAALAFTADAAGNLLLSRDAGIEFSPGASTDHTITQLVGFQYGGHEVAEAIKPYALEKGNYVALNYPEAGMDVEKMYEAWKTTVETHIELPETLDFYAASMGAEVLADFMRRYQADGMPFGQFGHIILDSPVGGAESVTSPLVSGCGFAGLGDVLGWGIGPVSSKFTIAPANDLMLPHVDDIPIIGTTKQIAQAQFDAVRSRNAVEALPQCAYLAKAHLNPGEFKGIAQKVTILLTPGDKLINNRQTVQDWQAAFDTPIEIAMPETRPYGGHADSNTQPAILAKYLSPDLPR